MKARAPWLAVLVAVLVGTAALAQPQRPSTPRDAIGPDDIRRVGDWLKGMNGGQQFDPELLKLAMQMLEKNPQLGQQLQDFKKANPNPSPQELEQFAKQLKQNPGLNEKSLADLKQFAEKLGAISPSGEMPPLPNLGGLGSKDGSFPKMPGTLRPLAPPESPAGGSPIPGTPSGDPPTVTPRLPPGVTFPPGADPMQARNGRPAFPSLRPPNGQFDLKGSPIGSAGFPKDLGGSNSQQQYVKMAGWWEKNVGPLKDSPAVQKLIVDFASGSGNSSGQSSGLGDLFSDGKGGETSLGKLADVNTSSSSNWKFPDLGLGKLDFSLGGTPDMSSPTAPSVGGGGSFGEFGSSGGSWLPVVILAVVAAAGLLLWWLWPRLFGNASREPRPLFGLGPWPVDPRTIADRAALVKAFEYLSVLRCGNGAKVWNHVTIATELRRTIPEVGDLAEPLARLYAVARYTPIDEPLAEADLAEARGHLCRLAGVSP